MRRRHWVIVTVVLASAAIYLYMTVTYYSAVQLRVLAVCSGNSTQPNQCNEHYGEEFGITVQDNDLEQSPKLKEALVKSPLAHPDTSNNRWYIVEMTPAEFDSMNRMLVKADLDAAKWYNSNQEEYKVNPTLALWPKHPSGGIDVGYSGNAYWIAAYYLRILPFTPWVSDWYP